MDIQSILTTIRDVIVTFSALIGAVVAVVGLSTWKKQIQGKEEYELARRLVRNAYKLRNALQETHDILVSALTSNVVTNYLPNNILTATPNKSFNFELSKDSVLFADNLLSEMESDFLEAEVVFKIKIIDDFSKLGIMQTKIRVDHRLIESILHTLHKKEELEASEQGDLSRFIKRYNWSSRQEFQSELQDAVERAENRIRKYLKRP